MSNRLPKSIRDAQTLMKRVEFDSETNRYYLVSPEYNEERIEVCGQMMENGTRCREPVATGNCSHALLKDLTIKVQSTDVLDILNGVLGSLDDPSLKTDLSQCIELARSISNEQLLSLDQEIRMSYGLMYYYMKTRTTTLTQGEIQFILGMLREIVRAKEIQIRSSNSTKLDDNAITSFVIEIFAVLRRELNKELYSTVVQAIYDRVILPRQTAKILGNKVTVINNAEIIG